MSIGSLKIAMWWGGKKNEVCKYKARQKWWRERRGDVGTTKKFDFDFDFLQVFPCNPHNQAKTALESLRLAVSYPYPTTTNRTILEGFSCHYGALMRVCERQEKTAEKTGKKTAGKTAQKTGLNPVQLLIMPINNIAKIQILLILKYQNTPYLKYIFQYGFLIFKFQFLKSKYINLKIEI